MTSRQLRYGAALKARSILITGHPGLTGSWACLGRQSIGANSHGFALPPDASAALPVQLALQDSVPTVYGDICDYDLLQETIERVQPELILHLAAQPLVRRSYREPVRTFAVNAQGTAHVLEAARQAGSVRGVLCITT